MTTGEYIRAVQAISDRCSSPACADFSGGRAGQLSEPEADGVRYLKAPVRLNDADARMGSGTILSDKRRFPA